MAVLQQFNAAGLKFETVYRTLQNLLHVQLRHLVEKVSVLEQLYSIYKDTTDLLFHQNDVLIIDSDYSNGWALPYTNTITLWTHDLDFELRGTHEWWDDVVTHEYAHIVSIISGLKLSPAIPDIASVSSHLMKNRMEFFSRWLSILHSDSLKALPGESSRNGADSRFPQGYDFAYLSAGKLLSWAHMQVGAGKSDDYEKPIMALRWSLYCRKIRL